jgi:hypothetical protein
MILIIDRVFFYKTEYGVIRKKLTIINHLVIFNVIWKVLLFSDRLFSGNFYKGINKKQIFPEKML